MIGGRLLQRVDVIFEHDRQSSLALLPQSFLLYSISIQLDGPSKFEVRCGEKRTRVTLRRGDMTIAPYRFSIDGAYVEPCEFLQLHLSPSVIERAASEAGVSPAIVPVLGAVDSLAEQTIYQLEEELTSRRGAPEYVNLLIQTLATHLVKYYTAETCTAKEVGGFPKYLLESTLDYINRGLDRSLSTEEIARAVGIEPARLARAFRVSTGKSIHRYLTERRVEEARILLTESEFSIAEVARRIGFDSEERFRVNFRRRTGLTPAAYRGRAEIKS
ncbi:MAG TPA: AraC family transcriptional regulator [Pyrinomonadaceae bacterium]|nr:AraC family transcriptional regulator [Pyrinomonadaceae bacterium]